MADVKSAQAGAGVGRVPMKLAKYKCMQQQTLLCVISVGARDLAPLTRSGQENYREMIIMHGTGLVICS